jgi:esterase/lipase superfamily enzyme
MIESISQLALLDALFSHWDVIRLLMQPTSPALEEELARMAARLTAARDADEIAIIADDLLDLAAGTSAHSFVKDLVARSSFGGGGAGVRGIIGEGAYQTTPAFAVEQCAGETARALSQVLVAGSEPVSVPVFFVTNRNTCASSNPAETYGCDLASSLSYGQAQVNIPVPLHRTGRVETPHWWTLFPNKNRQKRFVLLDQVESLTPAIFATRLGQAFEIQQASELLLFLHGYNVTFEEAARRAAQLSYDLPFSGPVILFSWPSLGRTLGYEADGERAAVSAAPFATFLQLLEGGPWKRVHLVAHSMGNRVLVLGLADHPSPKIPLSQIVLVAADVDTEIFRQKFGKIVSNENWTTSYASKRDRALLISFFLHRLHRIGLIEQEPFVMEGLETVDASQVDTSLLGWRHSYFGDERTVLTDLGYMLRTGLPAERRGLKRALGKEYWMFPR